MSLPTMIVRVGLPQTAAESTGISRIGNLRRFDSTLSLTSRPAFTTTATVTTSDDRRRCEHVFVDCRRRISSN